MKVQDNYSADQRPIDKLNRDLKNKIIQKEVEIENVKSFYDKKVEDQKIVGVESVNKENELNQQKISEVINQREERLKNVRESLESTKSLLENEQNQLKEQHVDQKTDLKSNLDHKIDFQISKAINQSKEINQKTNSIIKEMQEDSNYRIRDAEFQTSQKIQNSLIEEQKAVDEQNAKLETNGVNLSSEQVYKKAQAEQLHQQELFENQQKYVGLKNEYTTIHETEFKTKEEQHKHLLAKADNNFKQKYEKMLEDHKALIDNTKVLLDKEFNQLVDAHTSQKQVLTNKLADDFYHISTIEPVVTDLGHAYKIDIPVPEHEKENITLTPNKRDLRINMSRRFENSRTDEMGNMDKSSRSEVFTKTLKTAEIMESKGIKQNYENGHLSFIINKA